MLLPALNKAREKAKSITCLNNLKQIYVAAMGYADSYDSYLPGSLFWSGQIAGQLQIKNYNIINASTISYATSKDGNLKGALMCPSAFPPGICAGWTGAYNGEPIGSTYSPAGRFTNPADVNLNIWGGWQFAYTGGCKKLFQVTPGSVIMTEKSYWTVQNFGVTLGKAALVCDVTGGGSDVYNASHFYAVDWRHNKSANFLFGDGHATSLSYGRQFDRNWLLQ